MAKVTAVVYEQSKTKNETYQVQIKVFHKKARKLIDEHGRLTDGASLPVGLCAISSMEGCRFNP